MRIAFSFAISLVVGMAVGCLLVALGLLAETQAQDSTEWLGWPVAGQVDGAQAFPDRELGLRADGVVVWRKTAGWLTAEAAADRREEKRPGGK